MKYNGENIIEAGIKDYSLKTFSWYLIDVCNACTGEPLSFLSEDKCVECPLTQCGCDIQWNYFKQKT